MRLEISYNIKSDSLDFSMESGNREDPKMIQKKLSGKYGFFFHCLNEGPVGKDEKSVAAWNVRIDAFDTHRLAKQLHELDASWFFLTIGQNSGYYCAPNETYDRIVGRIPSLCSHRDLISDMADALAEYQIPMFVYSTANCPLFDDMANKAMQCNPNWDTLVKSHQLANPRKKHFQKCWDAIHTEWAQRWGRKIHGWWIDGVFTPKEYYAWPDEPNGVSFARALRAGNPEALIACNPMVVYPPRRNTDFEDFTAGETDEPVRAFWGDAEIDGLQCHILTYSGRAWNRSPIRFSENELAAITLNTTRHGGAITWDVPLSRENGCFTEDFHHAFSEMKRLIDHDSDSFTPALPEYREDLGLGLKTKSRNPLTVDFAGKRTNLSGQTHYLIPHSQPKYTNEKQFIVMESGPFRMKLPFHWSFDLTEKPFETEVPGFWKIKIDRIQKNLKLELTMYDKSPKPNRAQPWRGSGIELFLSGTASDENVKQYCILPDGAVFKVYHSFVMENDFLSCKTEQAAEGYKLTIVFDPSKAIPDFPGNHVLLELIGHIDDKHETLFHSETAFTKAERFASFTL